MKEKMTLGDILNTEKEKLEKYEKQYKDLQEKIKVCKANVQKYQLMYNNERLEELTSTFNSRGIKVEEIIAAFTSGDLTELQIKMDDAKLGADGADERVFTDTED